MQKLSYSGINQSRIQKKEASQQEKVFLFQLFTICLRKKILFLIIPKSLSVAELFSHSSDLQEVVPVPNAFEKPLQTSPALACGIFQIKGSTSTAHRTHSKRTDLSDKALYLLTSALSTFCYGQHLQTPLLQISLATDSTDAVRYKINSLQDRSSQSMMKEVEKL